MFLVSCSSCRGPIFSSCEFKHDVHDGARRVAAQQRVFAESVRFPDKSSDGRTSMVLVRF
jgi:hypothetical protein